MSSNKMSNEFAHGLNGNYTGTGVSLSTNIVQHTPPPAHPQESPELWYIILMAIIFVAIVVHILKFFLQPPYRGSSYEDRTD